MRDWIIKLRLLALMLSDAYREWRMEFGRRPMDDYYCCPGQMRDECGCHGATVRSMAEWLIQRAR